MAERSKDRLDELVKLNLEGAKTAKRPKGVPPLQIVPRNVAGETLHRKGGMVGHCREYGKGK